MLLHVIILNHHFVGQVVTLGRGAVVGGCDRYIFRTFFKKNDPKKITLGRSLGVDYSRSNWDWESDYLVELGLGE